MASSPGGGFAGVTVQPAAALGAEVDADAHLGVEFGYNTGGTVGLRGRYRWAPVDPTVTGVGSSPGGDDHVVEGLAASRVTAGAFALCPALGVEVGLRARDGLDTRTTWRLPVGLGVGRRLRLGSSVRLIPFIFPQAVLESRPVRRLGEGDAGLQVRDTRSEEVEARLDLGAGLATGRFYTSATVRVSSDLEGTVGFERVLELTAGVRF